MTPPFVSYITFNRLGLTISNLSKLLNSSDDFELHIIDSNSQDNTWDYIMSLNDRRIKTKERFNVNHGKTYALNMNLIKRRPDQYFFSVDNDVSIETADWLKRFLNVFAAFPEAGLLGIRPAEGYLPPVISKTKGNVSYLELSDNLSDIEKNYIPGYCMGLRPELIKEIGYFCEENCFGNVELTYRVCNHTKYKAGFATDILIQMPQSISCGSCTYANQCQLDKGSNTCFTKYNTQNKNDEFFSKARWKFEETVRDMKSGARPVYCASLLDAVSTEHHKYNTDWAMDNFWYFIKNAN